jgi:quinol monooxygenase YgiN
MKVLAKAVKEKEPGALEYVFHRSQKNPAMFMVYEKYKSGEAVQAHMTAPHFQEAAKKLTHLLEGGMNIDTYIVIC